MAARIILLNGVGSAGKSSIAKALQVIAQAPLLHVQMDAFLEMLPAAYLDHPDGLSFTTQDAQGYPEVVIHSGPVLQRLMRGMRHAIAAMAAQGNDMIVDEVLFGSQMAEYERLLAGFQLFRVGVFAPLELLEARERSRGDRLIGLARWQYPRVHAGQTYDLEVDTSTATPAECARLIAARFGF
ncbi:MAG: chloramphenicol phosphotransferase [Rhodospirillales bacterium 70-18]|nr:chloramphenicol phosphotransferase [Rhodospirillales bacterium]OJY78307.1 MAG: chloramphenicol phosphotransferase [Rhodospirillales bacterium 70-18]